VNWELTHYKLGGKIMAEKLNVKQLKARMDACLVVTGFFLGITFISSVMVYISL